MKRNLTLLAGFTVLLAACGGGSATTTTASPAPTTTAAPAPTTTAAGAPVTTAAPAATVPATSVPDGNVFGPDGPVPTSDVLVAGEPIVLSPTHFVSDVADDDFLNGRFGPNVGYDVNAELNPAYGTVRVNGSTASTSGGAVWNQVRYSLATELVWGEPGLSFGWVNSAFISPIPGWTAPGGGCDTASDSDVSIGDGASTATELYDFIAVDMGDCVRIVITFAEVSGNEHLGTTLPAITSQAIEQGRLRVATGVDSVLSGATDVFGDEVAGVVAINPGGGFWIDVAMPGEAAVRAGGPGQLIIDLDKGDVGEIFVHDKLIVALPPVGPSDDLGFIGYARPFESTLGLLVAEHEGDATYSEYVTGSSVIGGGQGVMTSGWLEAWGIYEFRIEDLPSGEYDVILSDNSGGGESPDGFPIVRLYLTVP